MSAIQGSESDTDRIRPPGSFPTDDMAPNSDNISTHQRSKLHKPNDPRGKGHGHSDSGVGLEPSNDTALTKEPVEEAYAPAEGYEQRREHAKRSDVAEFDDVKAEHHDTTDYNVNPKDLGTSIGTTTGGAVMPTEDESSSHNIVRTGTKPSTVDHKDPYWGDLPQGQGVYNTVSGHGSSSDEARRQHATDDNTDQRSFPLVTDRARVHHSEEPTTDEASKPEASDLKDDSHWKEGAAGAAVTGAAGAAAHKATHNDDDRHKSATNDETAGDTEKKGHGGLFGVFHRGSKEDTDKSKEKGHHHHKEEQHKAQDHHHKEKQAKEDKAAPVAAAGHAARDSKEQRHKEDHLSDNSRPKKTDPALAAAAVAYSQHGENRSPRTALYNDPATRGNESDYNMLTSGTASGVRTGGADITSKKETTSLPASGDSKESSRNAAVYGAAGAAAALGAGGYAALEHRKDHNDKTDPLSKTTQESPHGVGWFTGPISHTGESADRTRAQPDTAVDHSGKTSTLAAVPVTTSSTREPTISRQQDDAFGQPGKTTTQTAAPATASLASMPAASRQQDASVDDTSLAHSSKVDIAAAAPALVASNRDVVTGHHHSAADTVPSDAPMREPSSEIPRVTEHANHGKYNTLASGTPSGIKLDDDKPKVVAAVPTVANEKSNNGAMATAGIVAAGAGAGAAAVASRREDDAKKAKEKTKKKPLGTETHTSTLVSAPASGQQKITHKCVKCGGENDITRYFNKDKAGTGL